MLTCTIMSTVAAQLATLGTFRKNNFHLIVHGRASSYESSKPLMPWLLSCTPLAVCYSHNDLEIYEQLINKSLKDLMNSILSGRGSPASGHDGHGTRTAQGHVRFSKPSPCPIHLWHNIPCKRSCGGSPGPAGDSPVSAFDFGRARTREGDPQSEWISFPICTSVHRAIYQFIRTVAAASPGHIGVYLQVYSARMRVIWVDFLFDFGSLRGETGRCYRIIKYHLDLILHLQNIFQTFDKYLYHVVKYPNQVIYDYKELLLYYHF